MSTYAINTTRNREFEVESELHAIGLKPWVPRQLASRYVKEKRETVWYDRAYVPKLMFCVIPAIYFRDVVEQKHVIGKPEPLSRMDIEGVPAHWKRQDGEARGHGTGPYFEAIPGLRQFKEAVEAEYSDMERRRANSEYECQYTPGQALEVLSGPFEGLPAIFVDTVKHAYDEYHRIKASVDLFGRETLFEIDPDKVNVA